MSEHLAGERYVQALSASIADDTNLDEALGALAEFTGYMEDNPALRTVLQDPAVPPHKRRAILNDVLAVAKFPQPLAGFIRTLFDRKRLGLLSVIHSRFVAIADERLNRVAAQVTTAVQLTAAQEEKVRSALSAYSGKTARLETDVDANIIGGIVVRLDGSLIDWSLRARLDRVKHALLAEEI